MRRAFLFAALLAAPMALPGCGDNNNNVPGGTGETPSEPTQSGAATALVTISPTPGPATDTVGTPISLKFDGAMDTASARFVDLHQGSIDGPVVPMNCGWQLADSLLSCTATAAQPLQADAPYTLHIGAGMTGSNGEVLSTTPLIAWGGVPVDPTKTTTHNGQPIGSLGKGWTGDGPTAGYAFAVQFLPRGLPGSTSGGTSTGGLRR